ncbi:3'-5' exonuclease [Paracoccus ravus]|uniref:3'-5' exonuclease n=1 Tax=Paracoccus ravus TaxID=2447760 RepID=UPI001FD6F86F|nr:3'-5' exonuclease [Paracoccus ravus]
MTGLSLRLRIFLIFAGLLAGVLLALGAALLVVWQRLDAATPGLFATLIAAGATGFFGILPLVLWVWHLFDEHVARPIETLAGGLRTGTPPAEAEGRYLADLGPAARDAARARDLSEQALAEAVETRTRAHVREKEMLEAVLGDIGAAALMIDAGGRVIFFNAAAKSALSGMVLGCALSRHIRPSALKAAERRLAVAGGATAITVMTLAGHRLAGTMRAVGNERVLILRPAGQQERARATERLRRHAATLVPILGAAQEALPPAVRKAVEDEGMALIAALRDIETSPASGAQVEARALAASIEGARLGRIDDLCIEAEAGGLAALLGHLLHRLDGSGRAAVLDILAEPEEALISLHWSGAPLGMAELDEWLDEGPDADRPGISGALLAVELGSGLWTETTSDGGRILMPLPAGIGQCALPVNLTYRPAVSDAETLSQLTFVVFDTETTGLAMTDRIVQIAGLRIMGGHLTGERFETLVNPGRPIPAAASAIHGITDADVADAPALREVLASFRHFTDEAVLVAHNAPFDMGLLRAAEKDTGVQFPNRVLDTVLLSAMLWGQAAPHTLEALAERLGVAIPPHARHSAMGDAEATAAIFLRMIPALEAKGLDKLAAIRVEARSHGRLIQNADRG